MNISFEYAKALFELSIGNKKLDIIRGLLGESILAFGNENKKYYTDPRVKKEDKKNIINQVIEDELFKNFLYVLVDNDRFNLLDSISKEFESLYLEYNKTKKVFVYSKEKLNENYLSSLKEKLEKRLNSKLEIVNKVDDSMIAGIKIMYDSKEIDLTIESRLEELKNSLKEAYVKDKC